jgi:enoyl-CoA hydratase/carnithine racemase
MTYENVLIEVSDDFVAKLTLNRPDHMNTFNTPMANELNQALLDLEEDDQVRVILLKGAGKAFSAGIDINEFFGKTALEYREWIERMERPFITISGMKKPVIAQVHGIAVANGAGLVAASDLAIASTNAKMGLTAINVGLNCVGPVVAVRRSVGRKKALELLLYGNLIKSEEALKMGLLNRVVAADELDSEALQWAKTLAKKSPIAVQLSKKAYYEAEDFDYHKAFDYMNEVFARLCTAEDAEEGIKAFLEKRNPVWKQR